MDEKKQLIARFTLTGDKPTEPRIQKAEVVKMNKKTCWVRLLNTYNGVQVLEPKTVKRHLTKHKVDFSYE